MPKILFAITGSNHLTLADGTKKPTGFWAEEFVVPHSEFRHAGFEVDIATPGGVEPSVDQASLSLEMNDNDAELIQHYKDYIAQVEELKHPLALEELGDKDIADCAALLLHDGDYPIEDLARSEALGILIRIMHEVGKLIIALCHGPAGLLPAKDEENRWIFRDYWQTAFTNEEEAAIGLLDQLEWKLESHIRELGGQFEHSPPMQPKVVADRNLITGQNPASASDLAHEVIARLEAAVAR